MQSALRSALSLCALLLLGTAATAQTQSITAYNCRCPGVNCSSTTVADGSCQTTVPFVVEGVQSTRVTCEPTIKKCANLVLFDGIACDTPIGVRTPVCGTCMSLRSMGKNAFVSVRCAADGTVTLATDCDPRCTQCTGAAQTPKANECASVKLAADVLSVVPQGVSQCAAIKVDVYRKDNACTGTPYHTDYAAQANCVEGFSFQCARQPVVTPPAGSNVLVTTCDQDQACTRNCAYETVRSGKCFQSGIGVSRKVSCEPTAARCATMVMFQEADAFSPPKCSNFLGVWRPPCNQCTFFKNTGYMQVQCGANDVVTMRKCNDHLCQDCSATPTSIRPVDRCVREGIFGPMSVSNYGVHSCAVVDTQLFVGSSSCAPAALAASYKVSQEGCEFSHQYKCGTFNLTEIRQQQCCLGGTCADDITYNSGQCNSFTYRGAQHSSRATCVTSMRTCARVTLYSGTQCARNTFAGVHSYVCGSCLRTSHSGWVRVDCDTATEQVWFSTGCSVGCGTCPPKHDSTKVGFSQCLTFGHNPNNALQSYYNHGLQPCDALHFQYYDGDGCLETNVLGDSFVAQNECMGAEVTAANPTPTLWRYSCGNAPYPSTAVAPPQAPLQVLASRCSANTCDGSCNVTTVQAAECVSLDNGKFSESITCGGGGMCMQALLFTGSSCERNTFAGIENIACGVCQRSVDSDGNPMYFMATCNERSQAMALMLGCDATCSKCDPARTMAHPLDECTPSLRSGRWLRNFGMKRCNTVTVNVFKGPSCSAGGAGSPLLLQQFTQMQGGCEMGRSFRCGKFKVPTTPGAVATITGRQCTGDCERTAAGCQAEQFPERACWNRPSGDSVSAFCDVAPQTCAHFDIYFNQACTQLVGSMSIKCGQCNHGQTLGYFMPVCDIKRQLMTLQLGCNADCSVCTNPDPVRAPALQCSNTNNAFPFALRTQTVHTCDSVTVMNYAKGQCQGLPYVASVTQDECTMGAFGNRTSFSCSNAPSLAPQPTGSALVQLCDGRQCTGNCSSAVYSKGLCRNTTEASVGSRKVTCRPAMNQCVSFTLFQQKNCTSIIDSGNVACGQCIKSGTKYQMTSCDKAAGTLDMEQYDDSKCTVKTAGPGPALRGVHPLQKCTEFFNMSLVFSDFYPCQLADVVEYQNPGCQVPDPDMSLAYVVPTMRCGFNTMGSLDIRIECGDEVTTPAPDTTKPSISGCGCPGSLPLPSCSLDGLFEVGKCFKGKGGDPFKFSCDTTVSKCAVATFYKDNQCTDYKLYSNLVCGACTTAGNFNWFRVECPAANEVRMAPCTDSLCTKCGAPVTSTLDSCSPAGPGGYVKVGLQEQCNTYTVNQYPTGDDQCTKAPVATAQAPQDACSLGGLRVSCPNRPTFQPSAMGPQSLVSTCAHGTGCSKECLYESQPEGACMPTPDGGKRVECTGKVGTCLTLAFYSGKSGGKCANVDFLQVWTAVCGQCTVMPGSTPGPSGNYTKVTCTPEIQYVSTGCNSDCSKCSNVDHHRHPSYECTTDGGRQAMSFGLSQCNVVELEYFATASCDAATSFGTISVAEGRCNGNTAVTCGKYNLQQVSLTQCRSCTAGACPVTKLASGQCQPVATGAVVAKARSRAISCVSTRQRCVNVGIFDGAGCVPSKFDASIVAACGQCRKLNGMTVKITCPASGAIIGQICEGDANGGCGVCKEAPVTHPLDTCSQAVVAGLSLFNHGTFACDTVDYKEYLSQDCSGAPAFVDTMPQSSCSEIGVTFACGNQPYLPPPSTATTVYETRCSGNTCSQQCYAGQTRSGICAPNVDPRSATGLPTESSRLTCSPTGGFCATMYVMEGTTCTRPQSDVPPKAYHARCGFCGFLESEKTAGFSGWIQFVCDKQSGDAIFRYDCDSKCDVCMQSQKRPVGACVIPPVSSTPTSLTNGGVVPCNTVEVERYRNVGCNRSTMMAAVSVQLGRCEMGDTFHCADSLSPAIPVAGRATVDITSCTRGRGGAMACTSKTGVRESTCQQFVGQPGSYSVSCLTRPETCVRLLVWGDQACTNQFVEAKSFVCGSCDSSGGYVKCDAASGTVTYKMNCGPGCGRCTGPVYTFRQARCSAATSGGWYGQVASFTQCPAAVVSAYESPTCKQPVEGSFVTAQDVYEFIEPSMKFRCSNQPAIAVPAGKDVLITQCYFPENSRYRFCGGPGCVNTKKQSGTCESIGRLTADDHPQAVARKVTCGTAPGTCGTVAVYNGTSCAGHNFLVIRDLVCGQCARFGEHRTKITCDADSQTISVSWGCDAGCTRCTGPTQPLRSNVCALDTNPAMPAGMKISLLARSVAACNTVRVTDFSRADCSAASTLQDTFAAQGACDAQTQFQCGAFGGIAPTPPKPVITREYFEVRFAESIVSESQALALLSPGLRSMGVADKEVAILFSPADVGTHKVQFQFTGARGVELTANLKQSISNNAQGTAALFNAAAVDARDPMAPTSAPGGGGDDDKKFVYIGAAVGGVVVVAAIAAVAVFLLRRPQARTVNPEDIDEPMYSQFEEKSVSAGAV